MKKGDGVSGWPEIEKGDKEMVTWLAITENGRIEARTTTATVAAELVFTDNRLGVRWRYSADTLSADEYHDLVHDVDEVLRRLCSVYDALDEYEYACGNGNAPDASPCVDGWRYVDFPDGWKADK